ncbi:MAG: hypothetical protein A2268_08750 [Candidatus Raymondbacteria bacterium RifOxyA12_full_50_37]|uniref:DUF4154 domain-containing protein n=1 Tax=Candidatus Raymondbacteria bacterium RIFOXYD12_FULL_49_13 TaxID=1817890 RepID=A0A1F7FGY2_UNCRA|nr:MAG: hypothetical protein A2350_19670 [Candidatus Raymondbacteria bacterium RifOxyB12_full_50_8]OGJ91581.1 MAG: hypothetical protein A2268_08750 [Candidatus Raymondbacteria bacterium RifOxyA12_full_50_37]OGJ92887.1 MAG: hypothetical protein A2248_08450 [Candidatus Raymondbacteria bacterium RIFOXYA2_FULL_49_16]OGK03871.1 MAG: hypothetical protein A2487_00335 [Candidatus Raymondbacteria bacterium RifOxyC12_full_50_8]OGK05726.1 MAG: hypothetical protein A2519_04025 [Candidatus Raymondbacteria b
MKKSMFLIAVFLALTVPDYTLAQDTKFSALLVYNFTKYVEWAGAPSAFAITILGDDPITDELKIIAEKSADVKITIKKVASLDQVGQCDLLFISPDKSNQLGAAIQKFPSNTLIVTNKDGLGKAGSAINLIQVDGKLRFEINPGSLKTSGLKAKPALFKLGKTIES